jgi:hypothetical protein
MICDAIVSQIAWRNYSVNLQAALDAPLFATER